MYLLFQVDSWNNLRIHLKYSKLETLKGTKSDQSILIAPLYFVLEPCAVSFFWKPF